MGKTPAQEFKAKLNKTKKLLAEERKKEKAAAPRDLAFGLKNKKGAKQKINVDRLKHQAAMAGRTKAEIARDEAKKEAHRKRQALKKLGWTEEELLMGKRVVDKTGMARLQPGQDPKTVLCGFYKAGKCKKGKKCKFSHDLAIEQKSKGKKSLYTDDRENDTMDKWDQEKLEKVISQKKSNPNATSIVCKYFLKAIETKKYGWFWKCENGDGCLYQHKLPAGFVLKSDIPKEEKEDGIDLYEQLEEERAKLDISKCTPVTPETFAAWKQKQKIKKEEEMKAAALEKQGKVKTKKARRKDGMNGRSLFAFRPEIFEDDMDAAEDGDYAFEGDEEEKKEEGETKEWKAEEKVIDESEFLAALKLHEEEAKLEETAGAGGEAEAPAETVEEVCPAEPTEEEKAAIKKAKDEERKRKKEEKRKAKLAAKLAKKVKPLTAFEKKKLGLA